MGFDISNHAVDTRLVADKLIPGLIGHVRLDEIFDRSASLAAVAHRANQWGLRTVQLDHAISDKQRDVGPQEVVRREKKSGGLWGRLFGSKEFEE